MHTAARTMTSKRRKFNARSRDFVSPLVRHLFGGGALWRHFRRRQDLSTFALDADQDVAGCVGRDRFDGTAERRTDVLAFVIGAEDYQMRVVTAGQSEHA